MNQRYQSYLDLLFSRFNRAITGQEIIKWLENFPQDKWDMALEVLSNVEYLDNKQIIDAYAIINPRFDCTKYWFIVTS